MKIVERAQTSQGKPDIKVSVRVQFVAEESNPLEQNYMFSYTIKISNSGKVPAQLLSRHWIIADGWGRVEEVKGAGVVGKQPQILPGDSFEYSSFCPLATPTGTMHGTYSMISESGEKFDVEIPQFYLIEPNSYH